MRPDRTSASETPGHDGAVRTAPPSILVVDDDPDDVLLLRRTFRKAGLDAMLTVLSDGEQAVEFLGGSGAWAHGAPRPPQSLVLLDYKLPRRSGLEVLGWMAAHLHGAARPPTVVLTTSAEPHDRAAATAAGAVDYVVKPITTVALCAIVERWAPRAAGAGPGAIR